MTIEIVEIEDPKDWQVGDMFEGRFTMSDLGTTVDLTVRGTLKGRDRTHPELYVWLKAPYVTGAGPNKWTDVRVTREVEVPSTYIKFSQGSVVRNTNTLTTYFRHGNGWTSGYGTFYGDDGGMPRQTLETREVFEKYYELLLGSFVSDGDEW